MSLIENNGYYYITSDDVHVYPCGWRGVNGSNEAIDLESRLQTERNFSELPGIGANSFDSYIISWNVGSWTDKTVGDNILKISLGGYFIELKLHPSDLIITEQVDGVNTTKILKWINMQLSTISIGADATSINSRCIKSYDSDIRVGTLLDKTINGTNYFTGLAFTINELTSTGVTCAGLQLITSNGDICGHSLLNYKPATIGNLEVDEQAYTDSFTNFDDGLVFGSGDNKGKLIKYTGSRSTIKVPAYRYDGNTLVEVTSIGDYAFTKSGTSGGENNDIVEAIELPDTITTISPIAFLKCTKLSYTNIKANSLNKNVFPLVWTSSTDPYTVGCWTKPIFISNTLSTAWDTSTLLFAITDKNPQNSYRGTAIYEISYRVGGTITVSGTEVKILGNVILNRVAGSAIWDDSLGVSFAYQEFSSDDENNFCLYIKGKSENTNDNAYELIVLSYNDRTKLTAPYTIPSIVECSTYSTADSIKDALAADPRPANFLVPASHNKFYTFADDAGKDLAPFLNKSDTSAWHPQTIITSNKANTIKQKDITRADVSTGANSAYAFTDYVDSAGTRLGAIGIYKSNSSAGTYGPYMQVRGGEGEAGASVRLVVDATDNPVAGGSLTTARFEPSKNQHVSLGTSNLKWKSLYINDINPTGDRIYLASNDSSSAKAFAENGVLYSKDSETLTKANSKQIIILADNGTTTAGTWKAQTSEISSLADGQVFLYEITKAGATDTTLTIAGSAGGLVAKPVYSQGTTKIGTKYGVGNYLLLVYNSTNDCFRVINNFNSDVAVTQEESSTNNNYNVLFSKNTKTNETSTNGTYKNTNIYANLNTGILYANQFQGKHANGSRSQSRPSSTTWNGFNFVDTNNAELGKVSFGIGNDVNKTNYAELLVDNSAGRSANVRISGSAGANANGSQDNWNFYPDYSTSSSKKMDLGRSGNPWGDIYAAKIYATPFESDGETAKTATTAQATQGTLSIKIGADTATFNGSQDTTVTFNANAKDVAGYVMAPTSSNANQVWKCDANGAPGWRVEDQPVFHCSTPSGTAAKTVSITNYKLISGTLINIIFDNLNTANGPTLNINNTGARGIYVNGSPATATNLSAGLHTFYYDGTNYYTGTNMPIITKIDCGTL